jgi:class 3 adenylate cyclase
MPQIANWLARLGLSKYAEAFAAHEVDFEALWHLSDDDLKQLGLPVGPRRKILAALARTSEEGGRAEQRRFATLRPEVERRQLTVMFVDLVGSTELSQRLDPEELRDAIGAYQRAVSAAILRYEGHVAKLMGDGVLAYFGWPRAHEDDAERSIRAGLAAIAALAGLKTVGGDSLDARIGIATGLVVVGDLVGKGAAQEEAVVGEAPNLAARLQALADPNSVIVAESTHRLTAGLFETSTLGQHQLKGFGAPVPAWRVIGEVAADARYALRRGAGTPLIGRTAELTHLLNGWEKARAGQGQVVLISGAPGIGKSRLIAATEERLASEPRTLQLFCSPHYANSAFSPVIGLIERLAGIKRGDESDAKLDKLQRLLREAISDPPEIGALFAELLGIDDAPRYPPLALSPQARKVRTGAALVDLLSVLAARQPILMVVEDVHWIDPTTGEWLERFVDRVRALAMLLILSSRPGSESRWRRLLNLIELPLGPLARGEGALIAEQIAKGKTLPREVEDHILAKSEGVPLFIEEVTKTAIESGMLVDTGYGYALSGPLSALAVPATLQDSLMARLDRLGSAKELAQTGACIGRAFHHRLIAGVIGANGTHLAEALQRLEDSEMVFREGIPPEATYRFKHALIQNTAYDSLLRTRRRKIHGTIALKLESDFPEIVTTEPETLAYHHTAAGSAEKAVPYWLIAGQMALRRSANLEAISHLRAGIRLITSLPDSEDRLSFEIRLQSALGVAMMGAKGFGAPEVLEAMSHARILSEKLHDRQQLFIALCGEASYHMISGNLSEADALGHKCMALAETAGDECLLLEAHHRQWATKFFMGDYAAAGPHLDYGLAVYEPERHHPLTFTHTGHDPGVCCRNYSASLLWLHGYPDQAVERGREAVALAERVSHALSLVLAEKTLSEVFLCRREPAEARRLIAEWEATSINQALPLLNTQARFQRGWALLEEGQADQGVIEMREGIAAIRATGAAMGLQHFLCILAQGYAACGMISEGMAVIEEALKFAADTSAKYEYPELLRTKGELLLRLDPGDRFAEDWLRLSLAAAHEEGTKMLELRSATRLARLTLDHGEDAQARNILEPVYAWFTEGFTTPDLLEAKALLSELA